MSRGLLAGVATVLVVAACATNGAGNRYRVEWFGGFYPEQFAPNGSRPRTLQEIRATLSQSWYEPIPVTAEGDDDGTQMQLHSCADYLQVAHLRVRPPHAPTARVPFMDHALTCQAAQLITAAQPATTSNLRSLAFNGHLPEQMPWQVAAIISGSERNAIATERPAATWSEVWPGPPSHVSSCGEYCEIYADESGQQRLELVARGDFTGDGWRMYWSALSTPSSAEATRHTGCSC